MCLVQERSKLKVRLVRLLLSLKHASDEAIIPVLPPIPTTGLTSSDAAALAVRVHDQMVAALREISVPVPSTGSDKKTTSSISAAADPQPPAVQTAAQPRQDPLPRVVPSVTEADLAPISRSESVASTNFSEELSSPTSSRHGLDGSEAGTETEEDDGMVLVGRPRV